MKIPKAISSYEEIIKKSRFAVYIFPLTQSDHFPEILKKYTDPSANHNCWAWKVDSSHRFSDDGEPSGTAGKPIFQAIESQKWNNIAILVTRYFGGIKLGAGGLIRAYNGTVSRALQETPFEIPVIMTTLLISTPHEYTGNIYTLLKKYKIANEEVTHAPDRIILKIKISSDLDGEFRDACINATSGNAAVTIDSE